MVLKNMKYEFKGKKCHVTWKFEKNLWSTRLRRRWGELSSFKFNEGKMWEVDGIELLMMVLPRATSEINFFLHPQEGGRGVNRANIQRVCSVWQTRWGKPACALPSLFHKWLLTSTGFDPLQWMQPMLLACARRLIEHIRYVFSSKY
jgi:hypothetical protein